MEETEETKNFSVYLPVNLIRKLQSEANKGMRSRNKQLELIVRAWYAHDLARVVAEIEAATEAKEGAAA